MAAAFAPTAMLPAQSTESDAQTETDLRPTVSLVHPGPSGKLVYTADAQGNTIPDFSNAGYGGGGVPIPFVPTRETIWPVAGDNAANLQAAIERVSALPLDADGFRGALLLRAGHYPLATPVSIKASGVVLRGEGMGDTGTILIGTGTGRTTGATGPGRVQPTLVRIAGNAGLVPMEETRQEVTDDYTPVGSHTLRVANARGFKPGDTVIVRRIGNQEWIDAMGMNGATPQTRWRPFNVEWDRVVVEVRGNLITVDAPITCAIEKKWGGGEVLKYEDNDRIANVGVENIRAMSEFDPTKRTNEYGNMDRPDYKGEEYYADEDHFWNFVTMDNIRNGWVRNCTGLHFANILVGTQRGAKWITVEDCISREPVSRRMGARRFTFALRGELTLVQRCHSDKGRHSFMMGQPTSTLNVYLDCAATNPYSSSETHEQWATGGLYDNVHAPLTARFWKDIVIGWGGGNTVFWNCVGPFLVQKPPTAQNYSFGHIGVDMISYNTAFQDLTKEGGYIESLDKHVSPRSLYLTQLRDRLGMAALGNVAAPGQRA
ncbi:hypothetical protein [Terriglobus albidus]|uniref:hypothetical protein n=1 Tax=Terriglobus albidus TaxID=1592106 RepID=UPI0021E08418|nr:hypothetical protein [Terriglobus albidus]